MIDFEVRGQLSDHLFSMLRGLRDPDPIKLAKTVEKILVEENERGLKAGTDADGSETAELEESTKRRGRGGFGPERIPRFSSSWPIAKFEVAVARQGEHGYIVRAGWPSAGMLPKYFQEGTKKKDGSILMKARPIAGIRPTTRAQLEEATHQYGADLLRGIK